MFSSRTMKMNHDASQHHIHILTVPSQRPSQSVDMISQEAIADANAYRLWKSQLALQPELSARLSAVATTTSVGSAASPAATAALPLMFVQLKHAAATKVPAAQPTDIRYE